LRLALEGKNSTEIAEILGVSKSSIDHCEGWKKRKSIVK
jgi:DNA-binding CsgD family transcriptional regulator